MGARRMIKGAHDGIADIIRKIEFRTDPGNLAGKNQLALYAQMLVDLSPPARRAYSGIGVGERQVTALGIHQVDIELD